MCMVRNNAGWFFLSSLVGVFLGVIIKMGHPRKPTIRLLMKNRDSLLSSG